jgi:monothiol glutaredoxin
MSTPASERIAGIVGAHNVVLFMKGVPAAPQCGFSQAVVQILNKVGVKYGAVNVLEDAEIREGVKAFSSWPTIPQLYVKGEFVGGCDITREMYQNGELQKLLESQGCL